MKYSIYTGRIRRALGPLEYNNKSNQTLEGRRNRTLNNITLGA
jgi:hypothetical protein